MCIIWTASQHFSMENWKRKSLSSNHPGMKRKIMNRKFSSSKSLVRPSSSPRAWNSKLDRSLVSLEFEKSPFEHVVYKGCDGESKLLIGVYVDDLIITGSDDNEFDRLKKQMMELFQMSDLGLLSYYLGIEVP